VVSVVIIEDDVTIRRALCRALDERGHAVASAPTGMAGVQRTLHSQPDVVILDLGLPDVDGLTVLGMLRAVTAVPVIVATARDDEPTLIRALDAGADDYLVKPFGVGQLEARIRAVLRRTAAATDRRPLALGELIVDPATRRVSVRGEPVELTRKEFDLLAFLAQRAGEVVTKRELLSEVWQQPYGGNDRTVDVHLSWLRRKLGETAAEPRYLHSVRGVGIRLAEPSPDA
jgi:DNA-binding response OmpR family regulator